MGVKELHYRTKKKEAFAVLALLLGLKKVGGYDGKSFLNNVSTSGAKGLGEHQAGLRERGQRFAEKTQGSFEESFECRSTGL